MKKKAKTMMGHAGKGWHATRGSAQVMGIMPPAKSFLKPHDAPKFLTRHGASSKRKGRG